MWKPTLCELVSVLFSAWSSIGLIFSSCSADEIRLIRFKEPILDKALKGHEISSENVTSEGSCRVLCFMEPKCVSINVGPFQEGKHRCELNDVTAEQNDSTNALENMPGYTHLSIENPCNSSPCGNSGTCLAGFTGKGFLCNCVDGFIGETCREALARDCFELYRDGEKRDGVYKIKPDKGSSFEVFCDQTTAGGGWTVFQKRLDGSVDFYRGWDDYKRGFGNLIMSGEFWLGLEKIHRLTKQRQRRLRVDLEDFNGTEAFAEYKYFGVASEEKKYQLSLGSYSGTAGDSFSHHHGDDFSTKDEDNDGDATTNCAQNHEGAWWYKKCHYSNLNGRYLNGELEQSSHGDGVSWKTWKGYLYSVKRAEMKLKPINDHN